MVEVTRLTSVERPQKSAERIAEEIRRQIVCGDLEPDDALLSEPEMMLEFNVSRPTLREAFRILEAEQLIYVRRGAQGGARVRMPDATSASRSVGILLQLGGTTMNDVWEARILIEPPLARRLAERRRKSDLEALKECLDEHRKYLHDSEKFAQSTARFHDLVLTRAGNQTLGLLAGILDEIFQRHAHEVVAEHEEAGDQLQLNETTLRGHVRLVEIIESGDGPKAESAWRRHLELAGGVMLKRRGPKTVIDLYRS